MEHLIIRRTLELLVSFCDENFTSNDIFQNWRQAQRETR